MKSFNVVVVQHKTMVVENIVAESEEEANEIALERIAESQDWCECEPCYEVESSVEN